MLNIIWVDPAPGNVWPPRPRFSVRLPGMVLQGQAAESAPVAGVFTDLKGWWDPPPSAGAVTQRAFQHGGWAGRAYYSPRVLVLSGSLFGDDPLAVRDAFEAFIGGLSINELFPLVVEEGGLVRHVMVRLEEDPLVEWRGGEGATFNLQFVAPDWRRFAGDGSGATRSVVTGLPSSSGGLVFPASAPFLFDAVVVSGEVAVVNDGTAPAPVVVSFQGPVPNPSVQLRESGEVMTFALNVLAGQTLAVDFDRRTVRLNGVSRRGSLRGRWFELGPGLNTLKFDAAAFSPAATMTVSWSDAWK